MHNRIFNQFFTSIVSLLLSSVALGNPSLHERDKVLYHAPAVNGIGRDHLATVEKVSGSSVEISYSRYGVLEPTTLTDRVEVPETQVFPKLTELSNLKVGQCIRTWNGTEFKYGKVSGLFANNKAWITYKGNKWIFFWRLSDLKPCHPSQEFRANQDWKAETCTSFEYDIRPEDIKEGQFVATRLSHSTIVNPAQITGWNLGPDGKIDFWRAENLYFGTQSTYRSDEVGLPTASCDDFRAGKKVKYFDDIRGLFEEGVIMKTFSNATSLVKFKAGTVVTEGDRKLIPNRLLILVD